MAILKRCVLVCLNVSRLCSWGSQSSHDPSCLHRPSPTFCCSIVPFWVRAFHHTVRRRRRWVPPRCPWNSSAVKPSCWWWWLTFCSGLLSLSAVRSNEQHPADEGSVGEDVRVDGSQTGMFSHTSTAGTSVCFLTNSLRLESELVFCLTKLESLQQILLFWWNFVKMKVFFCVSGNKMDFI